MEKDKVAVWNLQVPKSLDEAVELAVKRDWHKTKAEFIREAVRRELERRGLTPPAIKEAATRG